MLLAALTIMQLSWIRVVTPWPHGKLISSQHRISKRCLAVSLHFPSSIKSELSTLGTVHKRAPFVSRVSDVINSIVVKPQVNYLKNNNKTSRYDCIFISAEVLISSKNSIVVLLKSRNLEHKQFK